MTSRRALLSSFVSSVPAAAALAQGAAPVITVILLDDDPGPALLRKELLRFGWTDGQNVRMSVRNAGGQPRLIPELTRQAVAEMPRLIVAQSAISFAALRRETDTIPIVVIAVTDPLGAGLSKSISRPTGNFTGYLSLGEELPLKHLQFLRTILPQARKVALLLDPANPAFVAVYATAQVGARAFGWDIVVAGYGTPDEILPAIDHAKASGAEALIVIPDARAVTRTAEIAERATAARLPALFGNIQDIHAGALFTYGPDRDAMWVQSADYVDRLLRGTKVANLPFVGPTRFNAGANLQVAQRLGITIPREMLALADEVIE